MKRIKKRNLAQFFLVIIFLIAFFSSVHLYNDSYNMEMKIHAANHQDIIQDTVKRLDAFIRRKIETLEQVALSKVAQDKDLAELKKDLRLLKEWEEFYEIYFLDKEGDASEISANRQETLGILDLAKKAQTQRITQISNFVEIYPGDKGLVLCTPIFKGNKYQGSILGVISFKKINESIFVSSRLNTTDILFAVSPVGEFIFGPDKLRGKNFKDFLNTDDKGYANYLAMINGHEKVMQEHSFPIHPKEDYEKTGQDASINKFITYTPLIIRGNFLLSVGMTTLATAVLKSTYFYRLNLFLLALAGLIIGFGLQKYNKNCRESLVQEAILQEKEKNLEELQAVNEELGKQKEAFASLWEQTAILNTDLFEKNKEINQQKENYEALWEETIALNQELLEKK